MADQNPNASWLDIANGLEVYADDGDDAGTVRVLLPSAVNLSPRAAEAFSRALVKAALIASGRERY